MTKFAPRKGMSRDEIERTIDAIFAEATLLEKVEMLSGQGFVAQFEASGRRWGADPYRAGGGCARLGVPAFYFTDGPRGVVRGESTCFPCVMARGASFDVELERRIGEAMGVEIRAQDCNLSGAVCVNVLRHPAWGRAQETYGEDPFHLGEMGVALATGIQRHNVAATAKHFALNSIENARFKVDVRAEERALFEVYLPQFKRLVDAGCATIMSAYNSVNGAFCGQNRVLLTEILRQRWGFEGFVHSDWVFGVKNPFAVLAGLDVENPEPFVFGAALVEAVEKGEIPLEAIETACRRVLRVLYRLQAATDPQTYDMAEVAGPAHIALAREAALKSAVLLKNEGVLPLQRAAIRRLAVLGRLADLANTGDHGSSSVHPPQIITPLAGLKSYLGSDVEIITARENDLASASAAVSDADAIVVVVGYTAWEEGEFLPADIPLGGDGPDEDAPQGVNRGGDRADLGLPPRQIDLIETAASSGKPVIVVLVAGSAVIVEPWLDQVGALLQTFYAGMEGGAALARLLFGDVSPSGKLPFNVAKAAADYPFFDSDADEIVYDLFHGYRLFELREVEPRFHFGHGLSYTRFAYDDLRVRLDGDTIAFEATVKNIGAVGGDEVVQAYVGYPCRDAPRPKRTLVDFARITLAPGESVVVRRAIPLDRLKWWDPAAQAWRLEFGEHRLHVGGSSDPSGQCESAFVL